MTGAESTSDDDEGSDDELEYMIWPLHSLSHTKIFMHDADILGAFKPYQGRVYITVEHCIAFIKSNVRSRLFRVQC